MLDRLAQLLAPAAVLLKDADGATAEVVDRLAHDGKRTAWSRPRIPDSDPRGTGCALATAIACARLLGEDVDDACAHAIAWLDRARRHTHPGPDGRAHLPDHGVGF